MADRVVLDCLGERDRNTRLNGPDPEPSLKRRALLDASLDRARQGRAAVRGRRSAMELCVGVDVAKQQLEVATTAGQSFRVGNDAAGISALVAELMPLKPTLVVLEASGGYEQELSVGRGVSRGEAIALEYAGW
jgi:hypothetical protein